jgi:flagellar hook-length control protein FliK
MFERNIKLGNNKFEIQIKPENLGKIEVIMEINGDNIDIAFKVDNSNVASLLSENNANLQKSLSSQGLNLNNFNLNYNSSNKFGEDNLKKEKKGNMNKNTKEEESLDLKIEKHYKDNNLVYIKA